MGEEGKQAALKAPIALSTQTLKPVPSNLFPVLWNLQVRPLSEEARTKALCMPGAGNGEALPHAGEGLRIFQGVAVFLQAKAGTRLRRKA